MYISSLFRLHSIVRGKLSVSEYKAIRDVLHIIESENEAACALHPSSSITISPVLGVPTCMHAMREMSEFYVNSTESFTV